MYSCDLILELKEGVEADVTVYFYVSNPGCPGDHITPSEGPEFEIDGVQVVYLQGPGWRKGIADINLSSWANDMDRLAAEALENYDELYEHQFDSWNHQREL